jgi:hypothetical protein
MPAFNGHDERIVPGSTALENFFVAFQVWSGGSLFRVAESAAD